MWHPPTTYCVEMIFNENFSEPRLAAGVCFQYVSTDDSPILYTAYAVGGYLYAGKPGDRQEPRSQSQEKTYLPNVVRIGRDLMLSIWWLKVDG